MLVVRWRRGRYRVAGWVVAGASWAPWWSDSVAEAQHQADDEGEGRPPMRSSRVGRFGITPKINVAFVCSKWIRGFKPRLTVKAEETHDR